MKFVIIGPAYPFRGGIAHHVFWLAQELSRRGHEVRVLSFRRLYPRLFFPGRTPFDSSESKLDPHAELVLTALNPFTWQRAFRRSQSFSPDAILIQWWHPYFSLLVRWLGRRFRRAGLKTILECHNVYPHERSLVDPLLLRFAFSPFRSFITHSTADRQNLLALFPGKTVRVAPLPTLREFSNDSPRCDNSRIALFFGVVRKYKGLDVLLRAMPKVLSQVECKLLIAGEFYEPVEKYRRLIRTLGIEGHVQIDDRYIPNEEVVDLFRRARVLIMPYRSATQSSIARIAIANHLPIIASRTGGLAEAIAEGENGWLVPPGDVDALADVIVTCFSKDPAAFFEHTGPAGETRSAEEIATVIEELAQQD
jgi:glycosyltransferase involved in cell wall biosynthesis